MSADRHDPEDELWIALSDDNRLRARVARTTCVSREVARRQHAGRLAATALGRATSCAAVFPLERGKLDLVSLQLTGGGPLGGLLLEHRHPGFLRGYAQHPEAVPRGSVAFGRKGAGLGLLPGGSLSVVKQDGHGGYTVGRVALHNGEIDEDVEAYFRESEQVPTRVFAEAAVDDSGHVVAAWGALVQALPPGTPEDLEDVRAPAGDGDAHDLDALLSSLLGGRGYRVLERHPIAFRCDCSRERVTSSLKLLDVAELEDMLAKDKGAEVTCRFCSERYVVSEPELAAVLEERRRGPAAGHG